MFPTHLFILILAALLLFPVPVRAEIPTGREEEVEGGLGSDVQAPDGETAGSGKGYPNLDEALRSRQYVHRALLSTIIQETSHFGFNRLYINHLMGFSQVYQKGINYAKYSTGLQGLSLGYIMNGGHAAEFGLELSAVSCIFGGYRYFYRPEKFSIWPFVGGGAGVEVRKLSFADGPPEQKFYDGRKQMLFLTGGVIVPLIDVGLKAEVRFNFYGADRIIFTQGIGVIIFL